MSIATQIGRIAKAKKDIKEVVNQDFEIINNETIDKYAEKMESAYDEYESYIPWEHGEGSEFTFKKGGTGSYLKELEINGNTHQTTIAAETGKEVIDTTINVNDVNIEKENYVTLKGNTHQDSYTGKNLFNASIQAGTYQSATYTVASDGLIAQDASDNSSWGAGSNRRFTLNAGTYTISIIGKNSDNRMQLRNITDDEDLVLTSSNTKTFTLDGTKTVAFKTWSGTYPVSYYVQIEQGSSATSYEPYCGGIASPNPDYPQSIEVVTGDNTINIHGKNLWNENTQIFVNRSLLSSPTKDSNNVWTFTSSGSGYAFAISTITLQAGTYTYSCNCVGGGSGVFIGGTYLSNPFTLNEETEITIRIYKSGAVAGDIIKLSNVMIEKGSTATTYEEYQSQTYSLNLGSIELCKIRTYQDYIYKENNKWYKHSEIGKVVLDGTETYSSLSNNRFRTPITNKSKDGFTRIVSMCNMLIPIAQNDMVSTTQNNLIAVNGSFILIRITSSTTTEQLQTLLSNNNAVVYYALETPTNTEITDTDLIEQLDALYTAQIYNPTFIETTTNNLLPYIDLKYNVITPSPSPERPSDIEVVTGDNTINIHGKNLFDKNNANNLLNNVSINYSTSVISDTNGFYTLRIDCKPNTTYTISKVVSSRFVVAYSNNLTYTSGETLLGKVSNPSATNLTITTGENAKTLYVFYSKLSDETTYSIQQILDSIQIEEGSTATTYEEYQSQNYPINLGNIELCKINDYKDKIDKSTGKNLFNEKYGQTGNVYTTHIDANNPLGSVDCYPINLLPNTQYTLTVNMSGYEKTAAWIAGMCFANGDVISLLQYSTMGNVTTTTFTTDSTGIVYVGQRYGFTYGETGRMDLFLQTAKIQIEEGLIATEYEPYGEQWYIKKEIGKVDLSTFAWNQAGHNVTDYKRYYTNTIPNIKYVSSNTQIGNGIAEKYIISKGQDISSVTNVIAIDVSIVSVTDKNTPSGLFYYALITPTYKIITNEALITQLEELTKLDTYNDYSAVTATGDLINPELECVLFSQPAYQK